MKYFKFNGINSLDVDIEIISCSIGSPAPNIIEVSVPFQNGTYDFSTLGSSGLMTYKNRKITVNANFLGQNKNDMYSIYSTIATSFLGQSSILQFNYINGLYQGRCTQISNLNTFLRLGTINITFECYPFLNLGTYSEQLWDTFNFETSVSEINNVILQPENEFIIINQGMKKEVVFNVSNDCKILLNNNQISLSTGDNNVILNSGNNNCKTITASENTKLQINFIKEII